MSPILLGLLAFGCFAAGAYQFILCMIYRVEMLKKEYFWRNVEGWLFLLAGSILLALV